VRSTAQPVKHCHRIAGRPGLAKYLIVKNDYRVGTKNKRT
jgi:hypothetical protein